MPAVCVVPSVLNS